MMRVRHAGACWRLVLRICHTHALTMPWKVVYANLAGLDNTLQFEIYAHEYAHIQQIERDGAIRWTATYLWQLITIGYWAMPYEIEARAQAARAVGVARE